MGRNKGDAARNKFRASSSSHAASLLQKSGTSAAGFGGFVGSARVDSTPASGTEHLLDVDGEVFLNLKRLSKKDPTTQLKALAALTILFEQRPAAEVSPLLPHWVFEYKRLVQDSSRQVRQSAHVAMTSLATCVGRDLGRHVRSLMGAWWVAQFDPSREVSEAAKTSFQVAFSGQKKRLDALMFCENEIFSHLDENLKLNPQTISDKAAPIEESTEKLERVVSCSLLALAALIDVLVGSLSTSFSEVNAANAVDGEVLAKTTAATREAAAKLCWNHNFVQQFLKSKSSRVRAATYQALRSFIQHIPEVFREKDMDVVVPSILGTFLEKDPACHQPMWDMLLLFAKTFPQAWGAPVVKKAVFPRLWGLLRHGCYGSQQISYPYLLPLISLIPPKFIIPVQSFLLEFFSSLWQGHTASQMVSADRLALLKAAQECLIWTVLNAKRFSDVDGYEAVQLQLALIDGVLVKLLWHDFIQYHPLQKISSGTSVVDSNSSSGLTDPKSAIRKSEVNVAGDPSDQFTQELGSCIVEAIQVLSGHGEWIMSPFWDNFQGFCFEIVQEAGTSWQARKEEDLRISRVTEFFLLLGSKTANGENREQWSLIHAVRPFVAKSFPAIRSLGHPESIRLIAKLTSIYGPTVFSLLSVSENLKDQTGPRPQVQDLGDDKDMLQYFRRDLVPWCLDGNDGLTASKAELVLAFIENHKFQGEWDFVIAHITSWQEGRNSSYVDVKQVGVLATVLEKVKERREFLSKSDDQMHRGSAVGYDWWSSPRIDGAAVKVASCNHLSNPACLRLLRSAIGGTSSEEINLPIVSDQAAMQILEVLLLRILGALSASTTKWIRSTASVIMGLGVTDSINLPEHDKMIEENLELAESAVNILGNCIFSLLSFDRDHTVNGKLLAAIFCLKWACSNSSVSALDDGYDSAEYDSDVYSEEETGFDSTSPLEVSNELKLIGNIDATSGTCPDEPSSKTEQDWSNMRLSLLSVWDKMSPTFCKSFSALTRFRLRQILITCLRLAVLDEEFEIPQQAAGRCAAWAQEVICYTCERPDEVSGFVDLLLESEESWPRWVGIPSLPDEPTGRNLPSWKVQQAMSEIKIQRHDRFAAFVDHLCRTLGPQKIFLGSLIQPGTEMNGEENILEKGCEGLSNVSHESGRIWLVVELLCSWEWPGGSAVHHVLPFLWSLARSREGNSEYYLLWDTIQGLFLGSSNSIAAAKKSPVSTSVALEDDSASTKEPFLQALLVLLKGLLAKEDGWSKVEAMVLFRQYVTRPEAADLVSPMCDVQILPHVLSVLMPILRRRGVESEGTSDDKEWLSFLETTVCIWLQKAMIGLPLVALSNCSQGSGNQWIQVAVACFPLNSAGGVAAMASASSAPVTSQERELLLALLRKQFSREATAAMAAFAAVDRISQDKISAKMERNQKVEVSLAKLVAVAIGYCWLDFGTEEWEFILKRLRSWLQEVVVEVEEFTEAIVDVVKESPVTVESKDADAVLEALEAVVTEKKGSSVELSSTAVAIFSLLRGLSNLEGVGSTDAVTNMNLANWEIVEMRVLEDILRILLAVGLAESSAAGSSARENGAKVIATRRKEQSKLWENVADVALGASSQAREAAIRAVDLWGVGKGAISSLYALLFSTQPTMSLQWVAYQFLSTHQILHMAITYGVVSGETESKLNDGTIDEAEVKVEDIKEKDSHDMPPALVARIRPEVASILETSHTDILQSPLTSSLRVSYLLGWSLLLTRLQSLTALSSSRERLVQYIQDSDISPTLLDCLFQYIPLEQNLGTSGSRRRNLAAGIKLSSAAAPATRAAASGSVAFAVEGLWPVQKGGLITMAGAIYGLMLLVLPACVRIWFTGLRDKSLASAIESFTTTHCSPQLLADEFLQVQASAVDEENLSIRANRSLREVTAIYKKEEAGMDIVIKIPSCYPLRAVDVECTRRMGVNETLLRKWILSMASFLRNQNGAVAEAVQTWKKNVDREFEGVEECPICYSIIHTSNHNLPRLACKTCRHKFHSDCLFKWFSTSHQSTCPLCKSPF